MSLVYALFRITGRYGSCDWTLEGFRCVVSSPSVEDLLAPALLPGLSLQLQVTNGFNGDKVTLIELNTSNNSWKEKFTAL